MATPKHDPSIGHGAAPPPPPPPVRYGQAVVGPPGSGKTTYCDGMQQYLRALGRKCLVVNFDPANERPSPRPPTADGDANDDDDDDDDRGGDDSEDDAADQNTDDHLPYDTLLDVTTDVICLSSVMEQFGLGPNGGLLYCMEYIDRHLPIVISLLRGRLDENDGESSPGSTYVVFDLPGQVELYTHNDCVRNTLRNLASSLNLRLTAVQLIDSVHCVDAHKFLSAVLLGTATMVRLELPSVNVLSKIDLLETFGLRDHMAFNLDFFTGVTDPGRLVDYLDEDAAPGLGSASGFGGGGGGRGDYQEDDYADDEEYRAARRTTRSGVSRRRHRRLHERLADVLEDFNLLEFVPLDVRDAAAMGRVVARVDRSNGYVFGIGGEEGGGGGGGVEDLFRCAVRADEFLNGVGPQEWSAFDGGMVGGTTDVRERLKPPGGTMGETVGGGDRGGDDDRVMETTT